MRKMDGVTAESCRAILAAVQTERQINRGTALPEHKTPSIHSLCICHTDPPVMQESRLSPLHWVDVTRVLTLRLLMSYIYGAPSKARNANVVYVWTYVRQR